jgi:uncharacterized membrane protein SirB2
MPSLDDLLYAFGQWLKTTPLAEFSLWLGGTPLNRLVDSNIWIAPVVQTIHILAIAAVFVSVQLICLRVLGLAGTGRTLRQVLDRYVPWIWGSLAVLLLTGLVLIVGEPARELVNPAFWSKMALILVAIGAGFAFQGAVRAHADLAAPGQGAALGLRAGAAGVILLWCAIIYFGRYIAYAPI